MNGRNTRSKHASCWAPLTRSITSHVTCRAQAPLDANSWRNATQPKLIKLRGWAPGG